jgi:hypothetical protein
MCLTTSELHYILSDVQGTFKVLHITGVGILPKTMQTREQNYEIQNMLQDYAKVCQKT